MPILLTAAASQPEGGWGRPIALVVAGLVFWLGTEAHKRYRATRKDPSPTPALGSGVSGVKPQVTAGSDTTSDTTPKGAVAVRPPLEQFVAEQVGRRRTMEIVREAMRRYGVSESKVKRAMRKARGSQQAKP